MIFGRAALCDVTSRAQAEVWSAGVANHCAHCKKPQGDFLLHVEPSGPFFALLDGLEKKLIQLMPLEGKIRVNGDEGFEP